MFPTLAFATVLMLAATPATMLQAAQTGSQCCTATIRARVPAGTGKVYLSGSLPELGPWRSDARLMAGTGRERTVRVTAPAGTALEYKFTLGTWDREALTAAGTLPPTTASNFAGTRRSLTRSPPSSGILATTSRTGAAPACSAGWSIGPTCARSTSGPRATSRSGCRRATTARAATRYPVLYMHDGQNLFDPRIANTGVDWGVDEAVMRLVKQRVIPPVIVVGAWSTDRRGFEYSPWVDAEDYARFLTEELMPRVNREFRTRTGPENTAVMGSSMGGLLSFYLVTHHPEAFGACGCVSTHFPLSESVMAEIFPTFKPAGVPDTTPYVVRDIRAGLKAPPGARYWFDYGTLSLDSAYAPTHAAVRTWLLGQGRQEGRDFVIKEYRGATHNEASWRARLGDVLTFLFGARPE